MKDLIRLLKPYRAAFGMALVALILAAVFNSALTGLITSLMDNVLTDSATQVQSQADRLFGYKEKLQGLQNWLNEFGVPLEAIREARTDALINPIPWAVMAIVVFCCQALFNYIGTYTMGKVGVTVVVDLRQAMIDKVMTMSMRFFKEYSTGDILTRINTDVLRIQQAISVKFGEMIKEAANVVVFLFLAFFINWKLSLTLFVLVPMVGLPVAVFSRKIRKYSRKSQSFLSALTSHLKEVLVGMQIVKGYQKESFESTKLAQTNSLFFKYALRELRITAVTTPVMGLIGMVVVVSFVCYGSLVVQNGTMSQGDFLFYILVIYQLYQPIKRMARANSDIQQAVGVLPRIAEVMEWDNEIREPEHPQSMPGHPQVENLAFRKVRFRYGDQPDEPWVLDGIDLEVGHGEVVALVGASGSGKSTLVKLLPRFYDISDGALEINGLDIRRMPKAELRGLFGLVSQDTVLFDDTVHNNIAYGLKDASREDVIDAAKKANAHEFIGQLADGYDTTIGESGNQLSGGQRQRLSIARAILKDAPVLILDEATSALDTQAEREVQQALDTLMKSKTTLVIAHRLSTIRKADTILVLDKGRIVERGDHEALMKNHGVYRRLIQLQEEGIHAL
ncbi:ABC transporter ATP-binding protein [Sulfidibacter corallicola]|uniref:ABC transporter ATP-binding protein n=1 Tax=Sulfidibacter corallicola TaxID=2818388 RepID=A0A8A4TX44_SULCO|nr:ABC transporter ATP-binding protein [Sulfidibacter corallicola]QTD54050.1 ABC transporter ATP-binding protein [Sulfidibacter corallicola]